MVIRLNRKIVNFDPYFGYHLTQIHTAWLEKMFVDDWTLAPEKYDYTKNLRPNQWVKGHLAETWEFTDPYTFVVHLRQGIRWQNIPPANGREFIADDVAFHFHRMFGLGSGYTAPSPSQAMPTLLSNNFFRLLQTENIRLVFKWKTSNRELILDALQEVVTTLCIENPEAVRQWGDLSDWHHAIGTGPFILKEFIPDVSATLVKNPNYWGHDERYPQNKLPYFDALKLRIIPNQAEALAEMRAGELMLLTRFHRCWPRKWRRTNPEILQLDAFSNCHDY